MSRRYIEPFVCTYDISLDRFFSIRLFLYGERRVVRKRVFVDRLFSFLSCHTSNVVSSQRNWTTPKQVVPGAHIRESTVDIICTSCS